MRELDKSQKVRISKAKAKPEAHSMRTNKEASGGDLSERGAKKTSYS